jgi:hypothetical protein
VLLYTRVTGQISKSSKSYSQTSTVYIVYLFSIMHIKMKFNLCHDDDDDDFTTIYAIKQIGGQSFVPLIFRTAVQKFEKKK